jgi:hypothetical protein
MSMATSAQDVLAERMPGDDTFLSAAERRACRDKVALAKAPNDGGAMGSAGAARRAIIAKLSKPIKLAGAPAQHFSLWQKSLQPNGYGLSAAIVDWPDDMPVEVDFLLHCDQPARA